MLFYPGVIAAAYVLHARKIDEPWFDSPSLIVASWQVCVLNSVSGLVVRGGQ